MRCWSLSHHFYLMQMILILFKIVISIWGQFCILAVVFGTNDPDETLDGGSF